MSVTTTAAPQRARPRLTPLDAAKTCRSQSLHTGRDEVCEAVSACGDWLYRRVETVYTPWDVRYLPTGQTSGFGSLPQARAWTGDGESARAALLAQARDVVARRGALPAGSTVILAPGPGGRMVRTVEDPERVARRLGEARRAVHVFAGRLVTALPEAVCEGSRPGEVYEGERACGGYLAFGHGWAHVDACRECVKLPRRRWRLCPELHKHRACADPTPVSCRHRRCTAPSLVDSACGRGLDACCGCCADG